MFCVKAVMPDCNGRDMPTSHGVDIETATIKSIVAKTSLKTTCCMKLQKLKS
ncbi:hypothetical protein ARTHRO_60147 [Limnospira indica PCC 8005]|uniref:Uncharacterized protein n=1 Tax=Limnospira indica PCC 8005 TaxID=376219 RepID=A0A9P1P1D2_9CYAN|nr:hypothetical protein ARTHRO_60147 [Limnospira indica PCC 8005]